MSEPAERLPRVGDRVKRGDATEASIRSYREMRGTIVEVTERGVRVAWDCDGRQHTPELRARPGTIVHGRVDLAYADGE